MIHQVPNAVDLYIRSISRHHLNAIIVVTVLIVTTFLTVENALMRHSLQQQISFTTSNEFIKFQQLANQTRALMRASADPNLPDALVEPIVEDIKTTAEEIRLLIKKGHELGEQLNENLLERFVAPPVSLQVIQNDLNDRIGDFIRRAEQVASATSEDRRRRYSFWGPIDFATSTDGVLIRQFGDLIERNNERSGTSVSYVVAVCAALLVLLETTVVLASIFLFYPLLRKLRTEHRRSQEYGVLLEKQANIDPLTGLANRYAYTTVLQELFQRLEQGGGPFSLLLVDLDSFKEINDKIGHPAGDAILKHVGTALQSVIRRDDIAARLGGDEFAVLLPGCCSRAQLAEIADRALEAIRREVKFEGQSISVWASLGGAIAPGHARDDKELVRIADQALYSAKHQKCGVVIFDERALVERQVQNKLRSAFSGAVEREEFVVHYQPKVDLQSGRHLGFEALVRWQHPTLGILPPGRFLPLIQRSHLIRDMTCAVIDLAARDILSWKAQNLEPGRISINLPEALLLGDDGYRMFSNSIDRYGVGWDDFTIEITEDVFLNRNTKKLHETIHRFREHGVAISLDDFGTGFASLVHLRDFPFDELKIDRSFVSGIGHDQRSAQIVNAVVDLARNLGKKCVAEGIETQEQREFLINAGCKIGQGYLFSKPQPEEAAAAALRKAYCFQESNALAHA